MPTLDKNKQVMQGLIDKANAKTGRNDDNLTDAVDALSEGFGVETPTQEKSIEVTANGDYDVTPDEGFHLSKVTAKVAIEGDVPVYQGKIVAPTEAPQLVVPEEGYDALSSVTVEAIQTEEKAVTQNGDVTPTEGKYLKKVSVNVPIPEGYIKPTGEKEITKNGTHNVTEFASVDVNVPIPEGYLKPTGTKDIVSNGTHDVSNYNSAKVNVPIPNGYIVPEGEKEVTENGTQDVTKFASVKVNVPIPDGYIEPKGSTAVNANGTHNVREFESVVVNVNPKLQDKSVTPNTSMQEVKADEGFDGLDTVTVAGVPTEEKAITANGDYTPSDGKFFSKVSVAVPIPEANPTLISKQITTNGTHIASNDNADGYSSVEVNVQPTLQEKTVTPSVSEQVVRADSGKDGLSAVTVKAVPVEEKTVTTNGEVTPSVGKFLSKVLVNVPVPDGYIKPNGSVKITKNGIVDVTNYASAEVDVPTGEVIEEYDGAVTISGEPTEEGNTCTGNHIIEVTQLPTNDIDKKAMYYCNGQYYKWVNELLDVIVIESGEVISYVTLLTQMGVNCSCSVIPKKTTKDILVSDMQTGVHVYYIENEYNLFLYTEEGWVALSDMGLTNGGIITSMSQATTEGNYYALMKSEWGAYTCGRGTLNITENGEYEVAGKKNVKVNVVGVTIVNTASQLSADAPDGSIAIVLKG